MVALTSIGIPSIEGYYEQYNSFDGYDAWLIVPQEYFQQNKMKLLDILNNFVIKDLSNIIVEYTFDALSPLYIEETNITINDKIYVETIILSVRLNVRKCGYYSSYSSTHDYSIYNFILGTTTDGKYYLHTEYASEKCGSSTTSPIVRTHLSNTFSCIIKKLGGIIIAIKKLRHTNRTCEITISSCVKDRRTIMEKNHNLDINYGDELLECISKDCTCENCRRRQLLCIFEGGEYNDLKHTA